MSAGAHDPVTIWRFIRRYFVRIVIGAVLVAAVYFAISIYATYQRERRIAKKIEAVGGHAYLAYSGPQWIPQLIRGRLTYWMSIQQVQLVRNGVPSNLLAEVGSLRSFEYLSLDSTKTTDIEMEHLKSLTSLKSLRLDFTSVTDAGVEYVTGLTNLRQLILQKTNVTDAGLEHLKGLARLRKLHLNITLITDAGLVHLRGLTGLTYLDLGSTHITDAGIEELNGHKSLTHLDVAFTQVSDTGLKLLKGLQVSKNSILKRLKLPMSGWNILKG